MLVELTVKQKNYITMFNIIVPFLIGIAVDLYVPSMPNIATYFHVSTSLVQLTISLYMLGYGIGQLLLGILSDSLGRRKVFVGSIAFFTFISFIAAMSPSIHILNLCRFLQGIGIAGLGVSRRALAADCFSGLELTKAMTLISTSWAIGPIIGPYIGGYLQHYFSWRANFCFFGVYGLFILVMTYTTLPETNLNKQPLRFKIISHSIKAILTEPAFVLTAIILSLIYAMFVIFNTICPFLIQDVLKYSAIAYGRIALFMGLGYFLGNFSNRYILKYLHSLQIVKLGLTLAFLAIVTMLILAKTIPLNVYIITIPSLFTFFSCGLIFPNLMAKCMGLFPHIAGTTSALFGVFVAGGVFLMTTFATTLKTTTQLPMVLTYLAMILICVGLFWASKSKLKKE